VLVWGTFKDDGPAQLLSTASSHKNLALARVWARGGISQQLASLLKKKKAVSHILSPGRILLRLARLYCSDRSKKKACPDMTNLSMYSACFTTYAFCFHISSMFPFSDRLPSQKRASRVFPDAMESLFCLLRHPPSALHPPFAFFHHYSGFVRMTLPPVVWFLINMCAKAYYRMWHGVV
jgi:hypothetical protein